MKRIDRGNSLEHEQLIERGHVALVAIASEAHAARVAAQKAELEVALSEARSGDASLLRSWLESYRGISESPSVGQSPMPTLDATEFKSHISFSTQHSNAASLAEPATVTSEVETIEPPKTAMSWDRLLPSARERLERRSNELLGSDSELNSRSDEVGGLIEDAKENRKDCEGGERCEAFEGCAENPFPEKLPDEFLDEIDRDEPLVYEDLPELQILKEADRDLGKPLFRSGKRGLIFSIVVHSALISTLMAITMRIPHQTASLGFEAGPSDGAADSFEVLQPVEVTSTEEVSPEMPSDTTQSSVSLPSAVGLSSTSVNAVSQSVASGMSGVQASANRAVAASSGRPNPSNANASFFGAAASGNCFCYVIDGSESMRGGPWEAAKAELLRSLSTMKASHRFYIIFFNQKLSAIPMPGEREPATSPLYATPENLKHARNWIESLRIERGAPPNDALLQAIEVEPDAIYLLADGVTKIDVPGFLRTKNRTSDFISGEQVRVPIHAIAFYSPDSGQKLMKQVALENKGQFIFVPDPRKK